MIGFEPPARETVGRAKGGEGNLGAGGRLSFGSIYPAQKFDKKAYVKAHLARTDRLEVGLLCLEPGQVQAQHVHDEADTLHYIVDGVATITVGKESQELGPGAFAIAKAGEPHSVANQGRDRLTYVVVSSPPHAKK